MMNANGKRSNISIKIIKAKHKNKKLIIKFLKQKKWITTEFFSSTKTIRIIHLQIASFSLFLFYIYEIQKKKHISLYWSFVFTILCYSFNVGTGYHRYIYHTIFMSFPNDHCLYWLSFRDFLSSKKQTKLRITRKYYERCFWYLNFFVNKKNVGDSYLTTFRYIK